MLQREFQVNLDYKEKYCPKRGGGGIRVRR